MLKNKRMTNYLYYNENGKYYIYFDWLDFENNA